jgi:hypothetical protein
MASVPGRNARRRFVASGLHETPKPEPSDRQVIRLTSTLLARQALLTLLEGLDNVLHLLVILIETFNIHAAHHPSADALTLGPDRVGTAEVPTIAERSIRRVQDDQYATTTYTRLNDRSQPPQLMIIPRKWEAADADDSISYLFNAQPVLLVQLLSGSLADA